MKKILAILLAVLTLLLMGCNQGSQEDTNPTEETVDFLVPEPMAKPDYSVSENPDTDELRQTAVKAMRDMLSIQWSAPKSFMYNKEGAVSEKDYRYATDTIYAGLPYADGQTNIFVWYEYYDEKTGRLRMDGDGQWLNDVLGNTCAGSLMWAWSTVCDSLTGNYVNYNMVQKYGCIPVGDYTYNPLISSYKDLSTKQICSDNGMKVMFESYAQIKMADAVTSSTPEHTMMAIQDAVVVRTADGDIDGQNSYIIIQDQAAGQGDNFYQITEGENTLNFTGRLELKCTFLWLFQQDYIPCTTVEFLGQEPYAKAEISFKGGECQDMETLLSGVVESNYPMCMLKVNATDADGKVTTLHVRYFDRKDIASGDARAYKVSGNRLDIESALKELGSGTYTITVEATASTGEVFTPVTFEHKN